MGTRRCHFLLFFTVLGNILPAAAHSPVFKPQAEAAVFLRSKRANTFFFEELLQGNLERECMEERCNKEEAREYFEDRQKTVAFWTVYIDGNQCLSNPCQNGGLCSDKIAGYECACPEFFKGRNCEIDISQCPAGGPLACEHFCTPTFDSYYCSCAGGYALHSDGRACTPQGKHSCGKVSRPSSRSGLQPQEPLSTEVCPKGHCPWQVSLLDQSGRAVCNGAILGAQALLTTATCVNTHSDLTHMEIGSQSSRSKVIRLPLAAIPTIHSRYTPGHHGNDMAFLHLNSSLPLGVSAVPLCLPEKDFSENILMQDGREGVVRVGPVRHSYLSLEDCRSRFHFNFTLTNKMFCMEELHLAADRSESRQGQDYKAQEARLRQVDKLSPKQKHRKTPRVQEVVWPEEEDAPNISGNRSTGGCAIPPGTPVASVEGKTAFLTGITFSHNCSEGVVFTKLSRFLPWINSLLDLSEKEQERR
ncbi:protein Z, vitamin K-dependent plasma glycoprotein b [Denticeps clupeoides]|uniref:protein Z, vitamin K-dependent plasma glycoprotein b n=1 Tax=Denticeps clupeoides TaxID=299321 RepID=UPI0010A40F9C|nr:vitamin K-dependent protein Z-like [Denticeps clupeoides]